MMKKLVTCPESGHLEKIAFEHTSHGIVIQRCSRFSPKCALDCPRECARRMDRRERAEQLVPDEERVLVIIASPDPATTNAATELSELLRGDRLVVDIADADGPMPPPQDYDAVVIGCGGGFGRKVRATIAYLTAHYDALSVIPSFFFGTSPTKARGALTRLANATGWRPLATAIADGVHGDDLRQLAVTIADEVPA
jgi:hypothetical protein